MRLLTSKTLILTALVALAFTSCKKDEETAPSSNAETTAVDNQLADDITTDEIDQFNIVLQANFPQTASGSVAVETSVLPEGSRSAGGSVTITPAGDAYPKTITIDYGDGYTDGNITRKGKIIGVLTKQWWVEGAELTITTENFSLNDVKVSGTKVLTSKGYNQTTASFSYTVKVNRATFSNDNKSFSWSADRTVSYYTNNTVTALDDYFTVTGSSSGTNRLGKTFTTTITKELKKPVISRWITSGTIEHKVGDLPTISLDYGDGTPDNKATISFEGKTYEISLHR